MNPDHTVDKSMCVAYGCPCLGTITTSTSGGDWLCGFHFNRDAIAWQRITAELNRLGWLVGSIRDLRQSYGKHTWQTVARKAKYDIRMNGREDLQPRQAESGPDWIRRLDNEVAKLIGKAPRPETVQPDLAVVAEIAGTFTKAAFEIPEHA